MAGTFSEMSGAARFTWKPDTEKDAPTDGEEEAPDPW